MKSFIRKIATSNFSIKFRNMAGLRPVALSSYMLKQNFTISDGFPWRTDNNFKTNFKYSDLLKFFFNKNDTGIEIHFCDKNNNLLKKINEIIHKKNSNI